MGRNIAQHFRSLTMKFSHLTLATAAAALLGGAAYAQQPQPPAGPTPGSVTGDWNGAHAPPDDKQYQEKVTVPVGAPPPADTAAPPSEAAAAPPPAPAADTTAVAATSTATNASFTTMTVTNGPVPDTMENRQKYGQPLSRAGKRTAAKGN
jgi:hypothetical protein